MSFDQPTLLIGSITIILGIFSLLNSFVVAFIRRRIDRHSRVADLYNEYYSADNYRRVVLPITRIALKWRYLPKKKREEYRKAIRRGWLIDETDPTQLLKTYVSPAELNLDPTNAHFHETNSSGAYTEHEALTVFLYFWTRLYEMTRSDLIDEKKAKRLLKRSYGYTQEFVQEFREDIKSHAEKGQEPVWVHATIELERLFD
ncbi:MAG: hypothetical protein ABJN78_05030 [Hyphomicrobiales bacterium]